MTRERPHDLFTEEEWDDLERATRRYSRAGRTKDALLSTSPIDGRTLESAFAELGEAAKDHHETIQRVLRSSAERRRRSPDRPERPS